MSITRPSRINSTRGVVTVAPPAIAIASDTVRLFLQGYTFGFLTPPVTKTDTPDEGVSRDAATFAPGSVPFSASAERIASCAASTVSPATFVRPT